MIRYQTVFQNHHITYVNKHLGKVYYIICLIFSEIYILLKTFTLQPSVWLCNIQQVTIVIIKYAVFNCKIS